jgi:hypothetical protein
MALGSPCTVNKQILNSTSKRLMTTKQVSSKSELLNRILQAGVAGVNESVNKNTMITKVTVRPNPFHTVLTLDVSCESNRNIIVRMFNEEGKIVKMFSWYLVKGTNVTAINELGNLNNGLFHLDIINNEGTVLFSSKITKNTPV